jgi:BirA family biotin operon repressor/biotin-[acetyl-CoA-carboxylase] ligase
MERILQILKENRGNYVSGEHLAGLAGITRAGIWKKICQLRKAGYSIESTPRRGYKLLDSTSALHPLEIKADLGTKIIGQTIEYQEEINSTNIRAKILATQDAPEGTVVIAERQTLGRGRMGRTWSAEPGLGLWLSLILRPRVGAAELAVITILAAVAMTRAVKAATGIQLQIKWPNDLLYNGRKLVGILAELNGEVDRVNYLILGIGLNVNHLPTDFPPELADKATSLRIIGQEPLDRKPILQGFLREFETEYLRLGTGRLTGLIDYARENSATLGKLVTVNQGFGRVVEGKAVDLDWDGSLWLEDSAGQRSKVYSGEIIEVDSSFAAEEV